MARMIVLTNITSSAGKNLAYSSYATVISEITCKSADSTSLRHENLWIFLRFSDKKCPPMTVSSKDYSPALNYAQNRVCSLNKPRI